MIRTAIIIGSTRPQRKGESVAKWALDTAKRHGGAEYELVDIRDFNLPLLDEPLPAAAGQYTKEHTKAWGKKIESYDAFLFVTPEYNFGTSAALKNALDFVYKEWTNKAAGFVGYGSAGAQRAIVQLRTTMGQLQIADVQAAVSVNIRTEFKGEEFHPEAHQEKALGMVLDQLTKWGEAMRSVREKL